MYKILDEGCEQRLGSGFRKSKIKEGKLEQYVLSLGNRIWKPCENRNLRKSPLLATQFKFKTVTPPEVEKLLMSLETSKASGPDQIPPQMLRDVAKELSIPLCHLINLSLQLGVFPTVEKIATFTPIFKSGESTLFYNYQSIFLLNSISKIVEKIACKQLTAFLESQNLLFKHQYGFPKSKCTQDAVIYVHDYIQKNMNQKTCTGAMFVDLRKAFDTVSYVCLLNKLPFFGITGIELNWCSDCLFNRKQYINFEYTTSKLKSINLGVPQGSILGPLLFLLLINDAYQCLENAQ